MEAQSVKDSPVMQETWIRSLGRNGHPLQDSCLENPMDRGAWWATGHGVARVRHDVATKPYNHHRQKII